MTRRHGTVAIVALLAPWMLSAQGRTRLGNIEFSPPAGWTVERTSAGISLTPTDVQGGEALRVLLLAGKQSSASLPDEFDVAWAEVRSLLNAQLTRMLSGGAFELDAPARSLRGWEYVHGTGTMLVDGASWTVRAYAIRAADRVERVVILAKDFGDNISTTNASLNPRYAHAIRELVFGMRFANLPPVAVVPAVPRGGEIAGVWLGLALSGTLKPHFAIFLSDGTAYFSPTFPARGLFDIDPAIEQPAGRRYWGTYTFQAGTGLLTMPYGAIPLRALENVLELTTNRTPHRYVRVSMPEAAYLEGNWCLSDGNCLRLTGGNSGRFEDTGAARILEHSTYPFPLSPLKGEGQYEVRDHTLVLRYDRGPEIRVALPGIIGDLSTTGGSRELLLSSNLDVAKRQ